jgi:putative heme transporter
VPRWQSPLAGRDGTVHAYSALAIAQLLSPICSGDVPTLTPSKRGNGRPLIPQRSTNGRTELERPLLRLEISTRGVITIALVLLTIWMLLRLWDVFILVVVSLMLATALAPFVDWLTRRGLTRGWSVGVVALLLVLVIGGLGLIVVPSVIEQGRSFADRFPELKSDFAGMLRDREQYDLANQVDRFQFADVMERDRVVNTSRRALGILISMLTVIVLTIYILADARRVERFFFFSMPDRSHEHINNLLPALRTTVGGYLRGQLLTSAIITVFTFSVLFALGIEDALGLAVLAGIADVIPLIGAFIAVVPATLAALSVSTTAGIICLILLLLYQQIEDRILVPRIYGNTLRLPAIAVFLAVIIGAKLMGILGVILALPAASAVRVLIMYWNAVRQGRIEPVAPDDELLAPDEVEASPATAPVDR